MTGLLVAGGALALVAAAGFVPVGASGGMENGVFSLAVRIGFLSVRIGGKKRDVPARRGRKPTAKRDKDRGRKSPRAGSVPVRMLLRRGRTALRRIVPHVRIRILRLHLIAGGADPADAALVYAAAAAALGVLSHLGTRQIIFSDLRADVDFDSRKTDIAFRARITIRVNVLVHAALCFGAGALCDLIRQKREEKKHGRPSHQ